MVTLNARSDIATLTTLRSVSLRPLALAILLAVNAVTSQAVPAIAQEAGGGVISADKALKLAAAGELVLVDVRSPQEWQQTGVPAGAQLVTIHRPDGLIGFLDAMGETLGPDRGQPVALICARGNRSSVSSSALAQAGYTQVYNVRDGISRWIRDDRPITRL